MQFMRKTTRRLLPVFALLALALRASTSNAQIHEVVVGVTMTCPYENAIEGSCWSGAYMALMELDGVKTVDKSANGHNCTARIYLKSGGLPDPDKWAEQFKKLVDQTYTFRGIEVTAGGTIVSDAGNLALRVEGVEQPISLGKLEHKLQWNSKKGAARQPEPDERDAYQQLASQIKDFKGGDFKLKVTGPLRKSDKGYLIEVREFFPQSK